MLVPQRRGERDAFAYTTVIVPLAACYVAGPAHLPVAVIAPFAAVADDCRSRDKERELATTSASLQGHRVPTRLQSRLYVKQDTNEIYGAQDVMNMVAATAGLEDARLAKTPKLLWRGANGAADARGCALLFFDDNVDSLEAMRKLTRAAETMQKRSRGLGRRTAQTKESTSPAEQDVRLSWQSGGSGRRRPAQEHEMGDCPTARGGGEDEEDSTGTRGKA